MSTEAGRPARHPLSSKKAALAALCLGALILNVDTTIVTVALPDLVRQTGATTADPQWVVDAHSLALGALVLAAAASRTAWAARACCLPESRCSARPAWPGRRRVLRPD
jgi:MFS family permease